MICSPNLQRPVFAHTSDAVQLPLDELSRLNRSAVVEPLEVVRSDDAPGSMLYPYSSPVGRSTIAFHRSPNLPITQSPVHINLRISGELRLDEPNAPRQEVFAPPGETA